MSKLKAIREFQNLTQEELAQKSGVSVRTIQRIETGKEPKGYTLKVLAQVLAIEANELLTEKPAKENLADVEEIDKKQETDPINFTKLKLINLSSIPFIIIPPFNIIIPLLLMFRMKQRNSLAKQLISIQILWTIMAPIIFMLGIFLKLGNQFTILLMALIVLSNVILILRNAVALDKEKKLFFTLNFSIL
ncbi:helix-turn-helix domain-containing protein [Flavobacterium polysaccharolyticum]|uniref:Helix-turn-helix transcriptional regulator n=1 Tax=Flavobacterium polysaccharolyticum TaxID=3133148 RepID=A0ABU9NKA5_9FLAO